MEEPSFGPPQTQPAASPDAPHHRGRGRIGVGLAAVAVAAAAFGVTSIASAATNTAATTTPKPTATAPLPGDPDGDGSGMPMGPGGMGRFGGRGHMGGPGMGMPGMGMGGALHGEFVVQKADGTYQTVDTQGGDVTAVSTSSITVKSVDGFSKTYDVTASTIVNAARDGIASVKVGDTVHLDATVAGDKATAVDVMDETTLKASGLQWHMGRKGAATTPSPSPSSA